MQWASGESKRSLLIRGEESFSLSFIDSHPHATLCLVSLSLQDDFIEGQRRQIIAGLLQMFTDLLPQEKPPLDESSQEEELQEGKRNTRLYLIVKSVVVQLALCCDSCGMMNFID